MNVDEAMAYVKSMKPQSVLTFKYEAVIHTLADEVERLRAELAAAKAASAVPVRVLGIYETEYSSDCYIECRNGDDCETLRVWLRERMKGGEG